MAKPIMSDRVLRDIFAALVQQDVVPYDEMLERLAKATKTDIPAMKFAYTDRYQQIKQVDADPFGPMPVTVG